MTRETRELTCINCPLGCQLSVTMEGGEVLEVSGNTCPRGDIYARKEVSDPRRIVTTTVPVTGSSSERMISVKTATDVPKEKIFDVLESLADVTANAPIQIGDVVLKDAAGTGVDIIATKPA